MVELHTHPPGGPDLLSWLAPLLVVVGVGGYLLLVARARQPWPWRRSLCWLLGGISLIAATSGGLAAAASTDFVAHMITHLLLGMVAPLLLVLAAPVTVLLRGLPVRTARRLGRILASPPARVLTEPVVAAVLNVGGLWLLYTTDLYAALAHSPVLHVLVHLHVLLAGYLFTAALVSVDPLPHRRGYLHRGIVLVLALAAHDVLAKHLYAHPPTGVPGPAAETGAMIMYYGGHVVDVAIMVLLCLGWYRASGRRLKSAAAVATSRRAGCSASST